MVTEWRRVALAAISGLALGGCVSQQRVGDVQPPALDRATIVRGERKPANVGEGLVAGACREVPAADAAKLTVIRQMLTAGKPHAAIAYLDAVAIAAPESDLLRADGLRQTGREDEAAVVYRTLLRSCVAGYAHQGLGLIASNRGAVGEAVAALSEARRALPADPAIRNDYGYALMLAGKDDEALHEFLTSLELAPNDRRAANNLLVLLLRKGDEERATRFAEQFGVSGGDLGKLREAAGLAPGRKPVAGGLPALGMSLRLGGRTQEDEVRQDDTGAKQ